MLAIALTAACGVEAPRGGNFQTTAAPACAGFDGVDYPTSLTACNFGPVSPTRLVVTTTDFATGAVSVVSHAERTVKKDVAYGGTDGVPFHTDGLVYIVHRYGYDYIDILDPDDNFDLRAEHTTGATPTGSLNPQSLARADNGLAFVPLLGNPHLRVFDFAAEEPIVATIDLAGFADADRNPEASLSLACGNTIFVALLRLDATFTRADCDLLVAIDAVTLRPYGSTLPLLGAGAKQLRADPTDTSGRTAYVLTSGLERVDLANARSEWALPAALFQTEGLGPYQLLAFDVTDDGTRAYIAAARADFSGVDIWQADLKDPSLERVLTGLNAVERTLEIIDDTLWFGDTSYAAPGMRAYDISFDPPASVAGPISTGLPPYSLVAIP